MAKHPKRPRDPNQLAKLIVELSTGETTETNPDAGKDQEAVEAGRKGGLRGGIVRAKRLTAEERSAIAKKAAAMRWGSGQK